MSVKTFADVEGALRTWLRTQSEITSLVGSRVFFGYPDSTQTPLITISRVGGSPQTGEAPLEDALVQFDCWGGIKNKAQAAQVMTALLGVLESMTPRDLDSSTKGYGASVESVFWSPDPTNDQARYVVTATVTVRSTA